MPQGPENRMLNRLKPKLEANLNIEIEKTNNAFRGGRPDWDVFGQRGNALFIEAKHWSRSVKLDQDDIKATYIWEKLCKPLQRAWMKRKAARGFPIAVLCGFDSSDNYVLFGVGPDGPLSDVATVVNYNGLVSAFMNLLEHGASYTTHEQEETV